MLFSRLISQLSVLSILLGAASAAVEIRWYNSYTCNGNYFYWYNVPSNTCYQFGPGTASSHAVQFFNVPSGAKGQVYTNTVGCYTWGGEGGSGTYCLNAQFFYSANWFYPSFGKLARRGEFEDGPSSTGFRYTTTDGERRISVPIADFEKINALVKAGDWDSLAGYSEDTVPTSSE